MRTRNKAGLRLEYDRTAERRAGRAEPLVARAAARRKSAALESLWFKLADLSPVTVAIRLTSPRDLATSLFRLIDVSDPTNPKLLGVTGAQSDRAVFVVPPQHLPLPSGKTSLVVDFLPVAPPSETGPLTLWIGAEQRRAPLSAYDTNSEILEQGEDGVATASPAIRTPCHSGFFLYR